MAVILSDHNVPACSSSLNYSHYPCSLASLIVTSFSFQPGSHGPCFRFLASSFSSFVSFLYQVCSGKTPIQNSLACNDEEPKLSMWHTQGGSSDEVERRWAVKSDSPSNPSNATCCIGYVKSPLCASVSSPVKWG